VESENRVSFNDAAPRPGPPAALAVEWVCQPLRARNVSEGFRPNRRAYSAAKRP
jgi:hypothetical protein